MTYPRRALPTRQEVSNALAEMPDERAARRWLFTRILADHNLIERELLPVSEGGKGRSTKQVAGAYNVTLGSFSGTLCKVRRAVGWTRPNCSPSHALPAEITIVNKPTTQPLQKDRKRAARGPKEAITGPFCEPEGLSESEVI